MAFEDITLLEDGTQNVLYLETAPVSSNSTLLYLVNEVLKRVNKLDSDAGDLTTLVDSPRQYWIDVAVQVLNEIIDEAYTLRGEAKPNALAESSITLATSTRAYALASDLIQLRRDYHLYNVANNHYIAILDQDGFHKINVADPEEDDTGLPWAAAIRPTDGKLYVNRTPTSVENGRIYRYFYEKDLELIAAADSVPFSQAAVRALVPAAAHLWRRDVENDFDPAVFSASMGRFVRLLAKQPPRASWAPRALGAGAGTDAPFST